MKALFGCLVPILLLSAPCFAEVVVPIDSVEEHVNIRLSPDAKSEIVGRLEQGDSAVLVATNDGWHEVEIVGGSTGFISADWTNVLAAAPTPAEETAESVAEPDVVDVDTVNEETVETVIEPVDEMLDAGTAETGEDGPTE